MSDIILGIDLGTTNSVVAVADGQQVTVLADEAGNRLIPSVVSFHPEGRILVGEEARERRLIDARNTVYSIKRLIGRPFRSDEVRTAKSRFAFDLTESGSGGVVVKVRDETYTLTEISAFVLREVRRIAEARLGESVSRAVITVPANFNELQRSATKAAGRVAGLEVARIINEPTAAALAYGYGKTRAERVAVYDLGGGTFDLTLLELEGDVFEVIGTAGDSFLGGDDIDLIITEEMANQFLEQHRYDPRQDPQAFERLRAAAEWAKCQLSEQSAIELTVEELAYGDGGRALDLAFTMSRAALEEKIQPVVGKSFDVCNDALRDAGMRPKDVDSVILVGGSTRIPLVRQMVEQFFGKSPRSDIDPDLVVAQGAAIHAMALAGPRRGKARQSLGKVKLRKMTLNDLREAQAKRKSRQETLPKQPAFAPNTQRDAPPRPSELSAAVSAKPLAPGKRPSSAVDEEGATGTVARRSIAVGQRKKSRTLLGLDDPTGTGSADDTGRVVTDRAPVQPRPRSSTLTGREDTGEMVTSAMSPGRSRVATASGLPTDDPSPGMGRKRVQTANLLDLDEPEPSSGDFQLGVSRKPLDPGRARHSTAQFGTGSGAKRPVTVPGGLTPPTPQQLDEPPQSGTTASGVAAPRGPVAPPPPARRARPIPKAPPKPPPLAPRPAPPPPVAKTGTPARPKPAPPSLPPRANITGTQPIGVDDLELVDEALSQAPPAHIIDDPGFDDDEATAMFDSSQMPSLTGDPGSPDSEMTLLSGDIELEGPGVGDDLELTDAATAAMASATMMQGGDAAPAPNVIVAPSNPQPLALGDSLAAGAPPLASTLQAPAAAQVSTPVLDIREGTDTPLLMDVTPLALGLEMAGGYCQHLIRRNAPIPAEQSRVFTTASDGQAEVEVRICQGDSRVYTENQALGEVVLSGLRDAARGAVRIEVTFILDASGTLDVHAKDVDTGQAQKTRINLLGGVSDDEIAAMQARQQAALSR